MMKKTFLKWPALLGAFGGALLLSACSSIPSQLDVPKQLEHNKQVYKLSSQQDLGTVAHYLYTQPKENGKNWKSQIEVLFDRNEKNWSLQQRADFRQKVFNGQGIKYFKFMPENDQLFAYVIYEPTAQNKDWQVNVSRGKQLAHCGFVQYQYSLKVPKSGKIKNLSAAKVASYLAKFVVEKEMKTLREADWVLKCQK